MKLTKRGEYALRTLIRLGIADRQGEGVISVSVLADQERLPFKFLEAILFELRQAGYVESLRGKHGGAADRRSGRPSTQRPAAAAAAAHRRWFWCSPSI